MSLRKGLFGLGMFIFCFGMVCAKTVKVDCFKGKSINAVLNAHKNADELIIEIDGICKEDVLVQRDNVTLIGINPEVAPGLPADGMEADSTDPNAPPNFGVALWIRDAANVTVESLRIFGAARHGLRITNSRPLIFVRNCRVEGNPDRGLSLVDSRVKVRDTTLTGNGVGAVVTGGVAIFQDCIFDEADIAVSASDHARARLLDSTVTSGAYRANRQSIIELENTDQIVNPSQNQFALGSQLIAGPPSNIQGPSTFNGFSSGFLGSAGGGDVANSSGNITCRSLSDLFCPDPASIIDGGVTVGCPSCVVP